MTDPTTSTEREAGGSRHLVVTIAIVVVAVIAAAVGGWLIGRGDGGERVDSLTEAIELANKGELPRGEAEKGSGPSTTVATLPDSAPPIVVSAIVTGNAAPDGSLTFSTRAGSLTLGADQVQDVEGLQELPGGVGNVPVGARVILFQYTFGPEAQSARNYKLAVLPPDFE